VLGFKEFPGTRCGVDRPKHLLAGLFRWVKHWVPSERVKVDLTSISAGYR
jgi:hypothetical protein